MEKDYKKEVKVSKIADTNMDKAIKKKKEMDEYGRMDISAFLRLEEAANKQAEEDEEPFYFYETDKRLAEEEERKYREEQAKANKKEKTSDKKNKKYER